MIEITNKQIALQAFSDILNALQDIQEEYDKKIQVMMPPFIDVNGERFSVEILKDTSGELQWRI